MKAKQLKHRTVRHVPKKSCAGYVGSVSGIRTHTNFLLAEFVFIIRLLSWFVKRIFAGGSKNYSSAANEDLHIYRKKNEVKLALLRLLS